MTIKGQTVEQWLAWVENELKDDGRENHVFGPDRKLARDVYTYTMEAFRDTLVALKKAKQ